MKTFLSEEEIKEIFYEYIKNDGIELNGKKNFKNFLKFLEIDIYDWIKENLRCYFRDEN